jgi:hypothetical protein
LTVSDLITRALRRLTVLGESQVPTAAQSADGLLSLNELMNQWQAESLMVPQINRSTWTIVSGTQLYLVGVGQAVNIARPVFIDHVHYQLNTTTPKLEIQLQPLTDDAWSKIPQHDLTSPYPTTWYSNPEVPYVKLYLWPVPTSSSIEGVIYYGTALAEFTAITQTVVIPPAYRRMIVTNLAVDLMAEYGINPGSVPTLVQAASESKAVVQRMNYEISDMRVDQAALVQGQNSTFIYNILAGP